MVAPTLTSLVERAPDRYKRFKKPSTSWVEPGETRLHSQSQQLRWIIFDSQFLDYWDGLGLYQSKMLSVQLKIKQHVHMVHVFGKHFLLTFHRSKHSPWLRFIFLLCWPRHCAGIFNRPGLAVVPIFVVVQDVVEVLPVPCTQVLPRA